MKLSQTIGGLQKSDIEFLVEEIQKSLGTLTIISPYQLSQEEIDLLLKYLPFIFAKSVKIENLLDKSLIAGVVVMYQSKVIDLSLKKRLEKLRRDLYEGL